MLCIVEVVGIVNDAFDVALVVAHLHACFKNIFTHDRFKYSNPMRQRRHSFLSQYSRFN